MLLVPKKKLGGKALFIWSLPPNMLYFNKYSFILLLLPGPQTLVVVIERLTTAV